MSGAPRKKINARESVEDILSGMADSELMEKYRLSPRGLQDLFQKLVDAGRLNQDQLNLIRGRNNELPLSVEKCPECGLTQPGQRSWCHNCGTILSRPVAGTDGQFEGGGTGPIIAAMGRPGPENNLSTEKPQTGHPENARVKRVPAYPVAAESAYTALRGQAQEVGGPEPADESEDIILEPRSLESEQWIMLLVGPVVALVCFAFFWFRWTLETFKTLVHEMGHAIFGWLFGYPSFPAFDFLWGGGITLHTDRSTALLIAIYAGFFALFLMYRRNPLSAAIIVAAATVHAVLTFTKADSIVVLFMGHGTELIIAGLFIYRSLSGRSVVHAAERPLYAIVGFFLAFSDVGMAFRLLTSASHRQAYLHAKGGDIDMDFIRISRDYLHVDMTWVVWFFLICCLLCLLVSFLAFRYEEYAHYVIARLWARQRPPRAA